MIRECKKCGESKPLELFTRYRVVDGVPYYRHECIECCKFRTANWNADNPDAKRRRYVERNWKMSLEEYESLLRNGCEVCGTLEGLVIDHDHSCCPTRPTCGNCIRGVLCSRHNLAEGNLNGDPNEAYDLAEYMKKNWKGETL